MWLAMTSMCISTLTRMFFDRDDLRLGRNWETQLARVIREAVRACQVVCVSGGWWLEVGVDSVGIGDGELGQGLFQFVVSAPSTRRPSAKRLSLRRRSISFARSHVRLSATLPMTSQSSLAAASSEGK